MPKVTVIVPVFKVEEYLEKCFVSLMNQKFRDFEIVLVDDGSPDFSGKMCDELISRSEEQGIPTYVIHQLNRGLSGARNSGIDWAMLCSGSEWLCFVDSDDTVSDMFIEKLYNAAAENKADLAVCDFMEVDTEENDIHKPHDFPSGVLEEKNKIFETMYPNWRIHTAWNKLYRKRIFDDLRFDDGKLHEDEFIIHKVLFLSNKVVFVPDMLYYYLIRSSGIMGTENRRTKAHGYHADIKRYWFCKKNGLRPDMWVLGIDYMSLVRKFGDKEITKEYKEIFFDYKPNRTIKKRISFMFFPIYNWYRKRRLSNG